MVFGVRTEREVERGGGIRIVEEQCFQFGVKELWSLFTCACRR